MARKRLVPGYSALYWFNEGAGTVLTDYSGNGLHGTLGAGAAAPTWVTGGLSFDGGDNVSMGAGAPLDLPDQDHTLIVVCTPASTALEGIFGKTKISTGGWGFFQYTQKFTFEHRGASASANVAADAVYAPGTTYVLIGVRSGNTTRLYIGATAQTATGAVTQEPDTAASTFYAGRRTQDTTYNFTGDIHWGALYPFALTPAQIVHMHIYLKGLLAARGLTVV